MNNTRESAHGVRTNAYGMALDIAGGIAWLMFTRPRLEFPRLQLSCMGNAAAVTEQKITGGPISIVGVFLQDDSYP